MGEQDNITRRKNLEQCWLLHWLRDERNWATRQSTATSAPIQDGIAGLNEDCEYTAFTAMYGSPTLMMSILTGRTDLAGAMDLTPYQLSFLVPKVRLYKTYVGQRGQTTSDDVSLAGKSWDVELLFPDNIMGIMADESERPTNEFRRVERMMNSRAGRGTGVGITGFSWKYEGTNPAEAANLLSANLSLHLNDVQELFDKKGPFPVMTHARDGEDPTEIDGYYQFVDLIMRTAATGTSHSATTSGSEEEGFCKWMYLYDPEYFELKAVVGWEFKDGAPFSEAQRNALRSASVILYLTIVDHVISYNEDGSLSLDIRYRAAIEGLLEDPSTDLFLSIYERTRQAQIEAMRQAIATGRTHVVTTGGNVSTMTDAFGNELIEEDTRDTQLGSDEVSDEDDDMVGRLDNLLEEMRNLSRGVGYQTLMNWLADQTHIPDQWGYDIVAAGGSTAHAERTPVPAFRGRKLRTGITDAGYGQPTKFPLSYGAPHGATSLVDQDTGIPRIKTVFVSPDMVGAQYDASNRMAVVPGLPPWASTGAEYSRSNAAFTYAHSENIKAGDPFAASVNSMNGSIGDIATHNNTANTPGGEASDAWRAGHDGRDPGGSDFNKLNEEAVEKELYFDTTTNPEAGNRATPENPTAGRYRINFVYFGDIVDWAVRKALWREPFQPEDHYIAMERFRDLAYTAEETGAQWAPTWNRSFGLDDLWTDGELKGPDGEPLTIDSFVEDIRQLKERKLDKINIILGCIEYFDPVSMKTRYINLADIPITLTRFNEWFLNKIMRPGVYSYSLKSFLKEALQSLVLDILGGDKCYEGVNATEGIEIAEASPASRFSRQIFDIGFTNFTLPAYKNSNGAYESPLEFIRDPDFYKSSLQKRYDLDKINASLQSSKTTLYATEEDNTDVYHFIALYARGYEASTLLGFESDAEAAAMTDNLKEYEQYAGLETLPGDLSRGIFHFYLGQNQGLVKSIKFTRTDQAYLAESRLLGHGAFGYNQLRGRYEATIVMQGNTFFLPGQFIYINPDSVGSGDWNSDYEDAPLLLGLGGYYVVIDVDSTITPEFFETTLRCVWHSAGRVEICKLAAANTDPTNMDSAGAEFSVEDASAFASDLPAEQQEP